MNNQPSSLERAEHGATQDPLDPKRALSAEALQRRRMLLKGASGGGAALVAITPLNALAGGKVLVCQHRTSGKNVIATVSGVNSAAASFAAGTTVDQAGGCSPAKWGAKAQGNWPCSQTKLVSSIMNGSACPSWTFLRLMKDTSSSYSAEKRWVCAYINACAFESKSSATGLPVGYSFPYTPSQVLGYISANDSKARDFFGNYMERL